MPDDLFTQARKVSRKIENHKAEGDLLVLQYAAIQKAIAAGQVKPLDLEKIKPEKSPAEAATLVTNAVEPRERAGKGQGAE